MGLTATQPRVSFGLPQFADKGTTGNPRQPAGIRHRPEASAHAAALEHLPHLVKQVSALWGEREFETYVNRLIMDSRNGKRQGLPWEAAQDLLFLVELSIAKRALVASQVTGVSFNEMYAQCLAAAGEPQSGGADSWSDPGANREVGRAGRDRPRAKVAPSARKPVVEKKGWWERFVG